MAESPRCFRAARRALRWTAVAATAVLLAACSGRAPAQQPISTVPMPPDPIVSAVTYWNGAGGPLKLDGCLPTTASKPAPAVILIHGGGFVDGTRSSMRGVCQQLAAEGFAAFSIDYRFAPEFTFPSQVDDVSAAVSWLRKPANASKYNIDPARIALIGSSAGAILAQEAGTRGQGGLASGDRVAAVVSLSGVSLMTPEGLALGTPKREGIAMILAYLGCTASQIASCTQGKDASALNNVDASDPPMLLFNSDNELVPEQQAKAMGAALTKAGVHNEVTIVPGTGHGLQVLDQQNREQIFQFLNTSLGQD